MSTLTGKTAFVTGGSRGIGRAIALRLAEAGAAVALSYRDNRSSALETMERVEMKGVRSLAVQMEVTDRASIVRAADEVERRLGRVSILVNNAGINKPTDFDQVTDADWDEILGVNLKGPFICAQVFLPRIAKAGGGSIIHIGSVSGQYGGPRTPHYAASKAGLISLSQVIARFGAKSNVRSNVVAAGLIESEMAAAGLASPVVQAALEKILLGRMGNAREVADAVAFLASDQATYITAQTVNVNGGLYF
jgi:NAD(P)-dependent dehydrogenase (short-subunit alcohol dehydrogenase family)